MEAPRPDSAVSAHNALFNAVERRWAAIEDEFKPLVKSHVGWCAVLILKIADEAVDTAEFESLMRNKEYGAAAAFIIRGGKTESEKH